MKFFKFLKNRKAAGRRSRTSAERSASISTIPPTPLDDDNEENNVDYSPSVQQQTDGAHLQKSERLMIKGMLANQKRYLEDINKLYSKCERSFGQKDSSFQAYETTMKLFSTTISMVKQIATQCENSIKELEDVLTKIPKYDEYPSIKSELDKADSNVHSEEHDLDALEKERNQLHEQSAGIQKKLRKCPLNTSRHEELLTRQNSVQKQLRQSKQKIKTQKESLEQAKKRHREATAKIYADGQENELARLQSLQEPLSGFVKALKIESISLTQAIDEHDPKKDLTSWKQKYFLHSMKPTTS